MFVNNSLFRTKNVCAKHHLVGTRRVSFGRKGIPLYQNLPTPNLEIYKRYVRCGNKNSDAPPQTFQPSTFASS